MRHVPVLTAGLCLGLLLGYYAGKLSPQNNPGPGPAPRKPGLTHVVIERPDPNDGVPRHHQTLFLTPVQSVSDGGVPEHMRDHWRVTTYGNEGEQRYYAIEVEAPTAN